ncbi:unnamed protein product [Lathyrus sativus]|nr:unnamed protein product [Lathyrus sativus]
MYAPDVNDRFLALSRAGPNDFYFTVASSSLLVLCDVRKPLMPILQWKHNIDEPCYMNVLSLSMLRSHSKVDNFKLASEMGFCIILGSFWNSEFNIFCYGPTFPFRKGSITSKFSKISTTFCAWEPPSKINSSSRECLCGICLFMEELSKDALLKWIDWQLKKEMVLGFDIVSNDLASLLHEPDEHGGFTLVRIMSSGRFELQRYHASWSPDGKLEDCRKTRARVKILDGPPGTAERAVNLVMVSAKEEPDRPIPPAVEGLLRVHKQVCNADRDPADSASGAGRPGATRLLVADTQAGSLIGKQGATIKTFQDATGCSIRILGSEHLPIFALRDDSIVEIQGESDGVHKAVELIALHLRKFLVDRSIVGVFETQMQRPDVHVNHNVPPHQSWGPSQGFSAPGGGAPAYSPNPQYMPPQHNYDNQYPTPKQQPARTSLLQTRQALHNRTARQNLRTAANT